MSRAYWCAFANQTEQPVITFISPYINVAIALGVELVLVYERVKLFIVTVTLAQFHLGVTIVLYFIYKLYGYRIVITRYVIWR